jgi:hypothetical protein
MKRIPILVAVLLVIPLAALGTHSNTVVCPYPTLVDAYHRLTGGRTGCS